jgi:hypothetical protein
MSGTPVDQPKPGRSDPILIELYVKLGSTAPIRYEIEQYVKRTYDTYRNVRHPFHDAVGAGVTLWT